MKGLVEKAGEFIFGIGNKAKENSPIVLTGAGVTGVVITAILAARAVPRALRIIEEEEELRETMADRRAAKEHDILNKDYKEVYDRVYEPITKKDIFKLTWKCFIPSVLSGGVTIACIVGAERINSLKQAAMAASYEVLRSSYDDYRQHVRDSLDKKRFEELEDKIREDKVLRVLEEKPLTQDELNRLDVEAGAAVFVEPTTGHRWVTTYEQAYRAIDEVENMLDIRTGCGGEDFVSICTFLELAGDKNNDFPASAAHLGFVSRPFERRIDKRTFFRPVIGEHRGHMCTLVYTDTDIHTLDDKVF